MFYDGSTLLGSAPALTVSSNDGGFSDWAAQFSTSSLYARNSHHHGYLCRHQLLAVNLECADRIRGRHTDTHLDDPGSHRLRDRAERNAVERNRHHSRHLCIFTGVGNDSGRGHANPEGHLYAGRLHGLWPTNHDRLAAGKQGIDGDRGNQRQPGSGRLRSTAAVTSHGAVDVVWRRCHSHGG